MIYVYIYMYIRSCSVFIASQKTIFRPVQEVPEGLQPGQTMRVKLKDSDDEEEEDPIIGIIDLK